MNKANAHRTKHKKKSEENCVGLAIH